MRTYVTTLGLAVAAAGLSVFTAGSAQAAPAGCVVGVWKATGYAARLTGEQKINVKGLAFTKLRIEKGGRLTYDFTRSKPAFVKDRGEPAHEATKTFRKVLKFKAEVTGGKSGSIVASKRSASGNAMTVIKIIKPQKATLPATSLIKEVRSGHARFLTGGRFTCSKTSLKIAIKDTHDGSTESGLWVFRRA